MSREKRDSKEVYPVDHLENAVFAVKAMDKKKRDGLDITEDHKKCVQLIQFANGIYWPGFLSISKCREVIQSQEYHSKLEAANTAVERFTKSAKAHKKNKKKFQNRNTTATNTVKVEAA